AMPSLQDWIDLARSTFHAVGREDLSGLYALDWPQAKAKLIAGQGEEVERAGGRLKRFLRTANAVLYGLSRRLAPARRVLFGLVLLCLLLSFEGRLDFQTERVEGAVRKVTVYGLYFDNALLWLALLLLGLLLAMELVDKINYRDELELARELQASLIPKALPEPPGLELAAHNEIANMVGGDIFDFVELPDGRLALLFGDASGHGMAAGLVMAVAHAAFRTQLDRDPAPVAMFAAMNRILCRTGTPRAFFGGVYLLFSPDGAFTGSVAGHPPALRFGSDGALRGRVGQGAYPLGIKPELSWAIESGTLSAGELLLLCSDGVTEAHDAAGNEYGEARLLALLPRLAGLPTASLVAALASDVRHFRAGRSPEDDVSLAAVRIKA
ncbi:MAG: PP2C family protein-serine/threonine phosphatase, partial [Thermoanaerobaculia bacterium]